MNQLIVLPPFATTNNPARPGDSKDALESALVGTFDVNHETGQSSWSPALKAIFGLPADSQSDWEEFWHLLYLEDRAAVFAAIMRSLEPDGPGGFSIKHRIVRPDGTIHWVHSAARTFFNVVEGQARPCRTLGTVSELAARECEEFGSVIAAATFGRPVFEA